MMIMSENLQQLHCSHFSMVIMKEAPTSIVKHNRRETLLQNNLYFALLYAVIITHFMI